MQIKKSEIIHIIIAVCTYKRNYELERCLLSMCDMNYPKNIRTEILIVDNDIKKSANEVCEKFKNRLSIYYTSENAKGLSNVRNKALKEAINLGGTHLAFIDDDEIADANWLVNHINFYNKFEEIYVSSGPTYKKFDRDYPDYIVNNRIFKVISRKELGAFKKTCASGNVFFPLDIIQENNIYFDEKFNFSGSEDTDFFGRLNQAGYKIGWNYNAVNFEIVTSERANIKWILKRAYNNGYCASAIRFAIRKYDINRFFYIFKTFISVLINFIIIILSLPFGMTRSLNSAINITKNLGKLLRAIYSPKKNI